MEILKNFANKEVRQLILQRAAIFLVCLFAAVSFWMSINFGLSWIKLFSPKDFAELLLLFFNGALFAATVSVVGFAHRFNNK